MSKISKELHTAISLDLRAGMAEPMRFCNLSAM